MQNEASELSAIASQLDEAAQSLAGINSALRWQAAVTARVRGTLTQYHTNISALSQKCGSLASVLPELADLYQQAEEGLCGSVTSVDTVGETGTAGSGSSFDEDEEFFSLIKAWLDNMEFWGEDKTAGALSDAWTYIEDLIAFFTGDMAGLSGASDWTGLFKSSLKSWKSLYEYFASFYHSESGFFSDAMNQNVAWVGLTAGFAGFISSFLSASDGLTGKTWTTALADYLEGCGSDIVTTIKSAYKLDHLSELKSLSKTEAFSNMVDLYIYGAIAEAGISTVSQGIRSYETYSADGVWDAGDTGATGIDISTAGIYGLSHALTFGLDDVIFGFVDSASGGDGTDTMSYAQKAAEGYKILAENIGNAIGNWWAGLTG